MSVEIVFETHSTSVDNERGIATGWLEGSLSEAGKLQAERLGDRRRDDGLAVIFTSDLRRATQTVEIAFAGFSIPIHRDQRLRECNYGSLNGRPRESVEAERRRRLEVPYPDGESWRQAVERVAGFLEELRHSYDGDRVLIIGHVATRWALDHVVLGIPLEGLVGSSFDWQEGWEYALDGAGSR